MSAQQNLLATAETAPAPAGLTPPAPPPDPGPSDAELLFSGEDIAQEVARPRTRKPPEPSPSKPEPSVEEAPAEEKPAIDFEFLENGAVAHAKALEARAAELEARIAELEPLEKKAALKVQDLLDELEFDGKLTREEMTTLAEHLIYALNPDAVDGELKSKVQQSKSERERARLARAAEQARVEAEKFRMEQQTQATLAEYRAEVKYATKRLDEYPAIEAWYGDDRARLQNDVMRAASFLAENGAKSDDDVAPEAILKQIEEELSRKLGKSPQRKTKTRKDRAVPATSDVDDDEDAWKLLSL